MKVKKQLNNNFQITTCLNLLFTYVLGRMFDTGS